MTPVRMRLFVRGRVQGVGFRPFVFRLARSMSLTGTVHNTSSGVVIEVEGAKEVLTEFAISVQSNPPPGASVQGMESAYLDPVGYQTFDIVDSSASGSPSALVTADIATCCECLAEILDPDNRRYRYPFTNCTSCGPRYSIIRTLPYDRPNTSMSGFHMCANCLAEYSNPHDRRFHAQPNACWNCGPQLGYQDAAGCQLSEGEEALEAAVSAILAGAIVAVKGIGGFHLMVNARSNQAVLRLRERKHRNEKPFAMMYPDLKSVEDDCLVNGPEHRLLLSPEAPIVLMQRAEHASIADEVAPGNPILGVMMPNSPLHHLLLRDLDLPVVATSGNVSDEPMCIGTKEAHEDLHSIADYFLTHEREIIRRVDDSIVRVLGENEVVLRRARGYAPYPLMLKTAHPGPDCLAVGGHLKNAIALTRNDEVFLSQHIGDLDTLKAVQAHEQTTDDLQQLLGLEPQFIAHDLHPDYVSTQVATRSGLPSVQVQHHHAHVVACMADNDLDEPVLGVTWDGTGYGTDHTIWGGEFLRVDHMGFERLACLRPFKHFGGELTVKQPRRMALSLLYQILGVEETLKTKCATLQAFNERERRMLLDLWQKMPEAPVSSSVGRLFDGVSSLLGLCQNNDYEGQGAMMLEWAIRSTKRREPYHFPLIEKDGVHCQHLDWEPLLFELLSDMANGEKTGVMAKRFHDALTVAISSVAVSHAIPAVVLTGGCFQNAYLYEQTTLKLKNAGFRVYSHQRIPPGDGGLAVGQAIIGRRMAYSGGN